MTLWEQYDSIVSEMAVTAYADRGENFGGWLLEKRRLADALRDQIQGENHGLLESFRQYAALEASIEDFDCPHDADHLCDCGRRQHQMYLRAQKMRNSLLAGNQPSTEVSSSTAASSAQKTSPDRSEDEQG